MGQRRRRHFFCLIALTIATTHAGAQQSIDKVIGSITAQSRQTYGSLETVNGEITIETGATIKAARTVNGSISVADNASTGVAKRRQANDLLHAIPATDRARLSLESWAPVSR